MQIYSNTRPPLRYIPNRAGTRGMSGSETLALFGGETEGARRAEARKGIAFTTMR